MSRNGIVERLVLPDGEIRELVEFPSGDRMISIPDESPKNPHSYWRANEGWKRGTRLTGGSSLSKVFSFDSGRLLNWKERMTCEGIAALYAEAKDQPTYVDGELVGHFTPTDWLESSDSILKRLKAFALTADDVRDRKADVGTRAHGVLEALAAGEDPQAQDGYGQAVINWWRSRQPHVLNCEQFVYSATHGFAGRFDLRAKFNREDQGGVVKLIDLKTSGWIPPSHHVQLALYNLAAKECGVGNSDDLLILQVRDDGTYREVPCRATEEDALNAIAVYRGAGRIERESGLPRAKAA